ncbi:MAG: ABC transporter ATP-binding protein [Lachnospiraceae bacterium]|nr:ABC transporter ATP-binding protein [Lachnospiraceae bacterium]
MISIQGLQKKYKDFSLDVSMQIPPGTVTGLIGRNGAGKSTTIKAILGLIKPDAGEVKVFSRNPREFGAADKEKIGVVLPNNGFSEELTPEDVACILRAMYPKFDESDFREKCRSQGISMKQQIKSLSTGTKAKLRVAVALTHGAELLVLDEPTAGLDVVARREVMDWIREYLEKDAERSVLISSHISTDLEGFCDDVYLIDNGAIVLHEETDTILDRYGVLKVSEEEFAKLDRAYLTAVKKEAFGYVCLTKEKQYFRENFPGIAVENAGIDSVILILLGGQR